MNGFRITTKVNAITGSAALIALTGTLVLLSRIHGIIERDHEVLASYMNQMELARVLQVNFKKQVQEWKDILLRGHEAVDFEKYRDLFFKQESLVRENGKALTGF